MMEEIAGNTIKPIVFKTSTGFAYFDYDEIIMCSAEGNCTNIFTTGCNSPIRILHNIAFVEKNYCNRKFIRCHKSHIINLKHLEQLIIKKHQVQLKRNFIVPLSNSNWKKIKQLSELNSHK
jgi:DNA-binding LytR/AlgR family response regulator